MIDEPSFAQTTDKRLIVLGSGPHVDKASNRYRWLLPPRHHRPRQRAAKPCDELAPFHSMTSSARPSTDSGKVRSSAFAVLRLMANSIFVGCITGRSAGFSPLRIRPM